jgi:hypothetical protein
MSNMTQRWWLEPKYASLLRDPAGLAWEISGSSVKCMTEEDFVAASGNREHQGHVCPLAQKWANNMTAHYDELAIAEPVFGELRNCMELALVGALVAQQHLGEKAGNSFPVLSEDSGLKTIELPAPTQVDSKVSMLQKGRNWIISASGGVMIRPGETVSKAEQSDVPATARTKAAPNDSTRWFWN